MGAVCKQPPGLGAEDQRAEARSGGGSDPARRSPPPPGARSRPDFPGGGARRRGRGRRRRGAAAFSSLLNPFSGLPPFRRVWARSGTAAPEGGRGQRVKPPPRPAQTSATVCSPHPDRHPGLFFPAGERASAAPQAAATRRVGFAKALGSPAGSASGGGGGGGTGKMAAELLFPPPPFNLKRRENGASKRAGECRGHGEEGQQRLRRLRLRRAAPPRRAARGRPPRRPRGLPGGAAAAASVMAPRRGRCFCTSVCGSRGPLPGTCGSGTRHCDKRRGALAPTEVRLT